MNDTAEFPITIPTFYIVAGVIIVGLALEALIKRKRLWSLPALIVYATTGVWYFVELIYTPENFTKFNPDILEDTYFEGIIFLVAFRLFVPVITKKMVPKRLAERREVTVSSSEASRILGYLSIIWIVLLVIGIIRVNGDVLGALFPLKGRAGLQMWQRAAGADAGSSGFLISSASYTYLLVCSFFGVLLPLQTKRTVQVLNIVLILISWPYFLLGGSRNIFLAVALPGLFSYALMSKQKWWIKILVIGIIFLAINNLFTVIIAYRRIGFDVFLTQFNSNQEHAETALVKQKHEGLNMAEELCWINSFYNQGLLHLSYGGDYLAELANVIPRIIWPDKPLIGIDYAILRGFGTHNGKLGGDIGVVATISTGFIGQGVTNFGPYAGPVAPAFLLALWAGFLARLWSQRHTLMRLCLFLAGLGITFNLGRDITLLVLWPIVFGYVLVRFLEKKQKKVRQRVAVSYYTDN